MTIKEIKDLTKFLTDEEVDKIKEEIKNKETTLKTENMEEEEMTKILNTLFAILVIEKTLENEIEDIENVRGELEQELLESYEMYDAHMALFKKREKKKKKRWLLDFLFIGDKISKQRKGIESANKTIARLSKELDNARSQKSNENLRNVIRDRRGPHFDHFCLFPEKCRHPHHSHRGENLLRDIRNKARFNRLIDNIANDRITGRNTHRLRNEIDNNQIQRERINLTSNVLEHNLHVNSRGQDVRGTNIGRNRKH